MQNRAHLFIHLLVINFLIINHSVYAHLEEYDDVLENRALNDVFEMITPERLIKETNQWVREGDDPEVQSKCDRDLYLWKERLIKEDWAMKMLDASSKIPSGILQGNMVDLGQYDECVNIRGNASGIEIQGRHCMYSVKVAVGNFSLPMSPTLSICVPSTCEAQDVTNFLNSTFNKINILKIAQIDVTSSKCQPINVEVWDTELIICTIILIAFVTFLVICTLFEIYINGLSTDQYKDPLLVTLSKFSLKKNAEAILNMDIKDGQIPAIHGIRFLSIAWIVLGHENLLRMTGTTMNSLDLLSWAESWRSMHVFMAQLSVDTFFILSSFLLCYLFLKQMKKKEKFNIPLYYVHRYIRLTPTIIALTIFTIVFVPKLGSGPLWDTTMSSECRINWWTNLVYLQNTLDKTKRLCLGHLWYLSVDMQLFWISPLILYPLHRVPRVGLAILAAFFLTSIAVPAAIVGIDELPYLSFIHSTDIVRIMDIFSNVYQTTYTRAGPWFVGIYLGFEVVNYKRRLTKLTATIGWGVAIFCFAFCTFGMRSFMEADYVYNVAWETFFAAVFRPIWGMGVSWIIFASINGYGGFISTFLSWKGFLPLSRLSYCIYLLHSVIQPLHEVTTRTVPYFSVYTVIRSFFGTLAVSTAAAFVFSLLFESPIMILEKMLFHRKPKSRSDSQRDLQNDENGEFKSENA